LLKEKGENVHWDVIVKKAERYVVKIETPSGHGTGFLCAYDREQDICAIATALHVVNEANRWQQPIRISNHDLSSTVLLKDTNRRIVAQPKNDSAAILCVR